jgi:superfamily II DNA/RNA helicase
VNITSSIIFTNTKERAERLYHALTDRGFPCSVIYGEPMTQAVRQQRMQDFRSGTTRVLIATNLLARGIDVQQVGIVFNYDMPSFEDKENYIHRIGRCGRYGRKGSSVSLLNPTEKTVMDMIAKHYSFEPKPVPEDLSKIIVSGS